jgi:hypothetical protein
MRAETEFLAARRLKCHAAIRANKTPDTVTPHDLLPYGKLCTEVGLGYLTRTVGIFLGELAEWCYANDLPPLNSLAINAEEMKPGPGYDGAAGCSEITWWQEVMACVAAEYPARIP